MAPEQVVYLETERKLIADIIKTVAYRAESAMLAQLGLAPTSCQNEGQAFLKAVFQSTADLLACNESKQLVVQFHSMTQSRFNRVLQELCEQVTEQKITYPGTDLVMVFQAP